MDTLTETFNRHFHINMIILWGLLILDIGEQRDKKRSKRILKLDREFNAKSMKQARDRYHRQVAVRPPPRP